MKKLLNFIPVLAVISALTVLSLNVSQADMPCYGNLYVTVTGNGHDIASLYAKHKSTSNNYPLSVTGDEGVYYAAGLPCGGYDIFACASGAQTVGYTIADVKDDTDHSEAKLQLFGGQCNYE